MPYTSGKPKATKGSKGKKADDKAAKKRRMSEMASKMASGKKVFGFGRR